MKPLLPPTFLPALGDSLSETIEQVAFEEVIPDPDLPPSDGPENFAPEIAWAMIEIIDPLPGTLALILPAELHCHLTSSVYSIPPGELTETMLLDDVAELINTIAGRLMARLLSPMDPFRLGLPRSGRGNPPWPAGQESNFHTFAYRIGEQRFFVRFAPAEIPTDLRSE
jgi:hypothetical protein